MATKREHIFISYRAIDSQTAAWLLNVLLTKHFGHDRVFFGPTQMSPGENFPSRIIKELERSGVIIAVIGKHWLRAADNYGNRLLYLKNDWVRRELSYGLNREVLVLPVLVDGASLPTEAEAATALPKDLRALTTRQAIRVEESPRLVAIIEQALGNAGSQDQVDHKDDTVIVLSKGPATTDTPSPQDDRRQNNFIEAAERNRFIEILSGDCPWSLREYTVDSSTAKNSFLIESELLTCQAVILLVDADALQCSFTARFFEIAAWRRALGMPLVTLLFPGTTLRQLKASSSNYLADYFVLEATPKAAGNRAEMLGNKGEIIKQYLRETLALRRHSFHSEPATKWVSDVAEILAKVSKQKLLALAEHLHISHLPAGSRDSYNRVIAAALFVARLDDAYIFLREAVSELKEEGAPHKTVQALVDRALPLWVDLDAGRVILSAADLPPGRRLCELRLSRLQWGEHAVNRASASARKYRSVVLSSSTSTADSQKDVSPSVRPMVLPSVAGEHKVEELLRRHDATLRQQLNFQPDDTTRFIEEQLARVNRAVFAILDSRNLVPKELRRLVRALRERFPGITFLLVSEDDNRTWSFHPPPLVALDWLDEDEERRIAHYIRFAESLVTGDS